MVTIAIEQFQQNALDAIRRVEAGETVQILRNNKTIAEIKPPPDRRPSGLYQGQITVPPDIADPLPPDILKDFEGT